jgi:hypothetical protein
MNRSYVNHSGVTEHELLLVVFHDEGTLTACVLEGVVGNAVTGVDEQYRSVKRGLLSRRFAEQ